MSMLILGICLGLTLSICLRPALRSSLSATRPDGQWQHAQQLLAADGYPNSYWVWDDESVAQSQAAGRAELVKLFWPAAAQTQTVTVAPKLVSRRTQPRDSRGRFTSTKRPVQKLAWDLTDSELNQSIH